MKNNEFSESANKFIDSIVHLRNMADTIRTTDPDFADSLRKVINNSVETVSDMNPDLGLLLQLMD